MRTQLATGESATWTHASGSGFPDASGAGWLRLSDHSPTPDRPVHDDVAYPWQIAQLADNSPSPDLHGWLCPLPPVPGIQLQGHMTGRMKCAAGHIRRMCCAGSFALLRQHGMGRIYWIDYPFLQRTLEEMPDGIGFFAAGREQHRDNLRRTVDSFCGALLPVACRLAHEEGLEFFSVMKPYDLWALRRQPVSERALASFPRTLGGYCGTSDPFVAAHPEFSFRRNPAWTRLPGPRRVTGVTLYTDSDAPLPFAAQELALFAGDENVSYTRCGGRVSEVLVERPRQRWTPAQSVRPAANACAR